eukprot:m.219308 g.219308  ORF g.219308 m.219308 type:complete len:78 (-) comp26283_c1_seq1:676-909(-)
MRYLSDSWSHLFTQHLNEALTSHGHVFLALLSTQVQPTAAASGDQRFETRSRSNRYDLLQRVCNGGSKHAFCLVRRE